MTRTNKKSSLKTALGTRKKVVRKKRTAVLAATALGVRSEHLVDHLKTPVERNPAPVGPLTDMRAAWSAPIIPRFNLALRAGAPTLLTMPRLMHRPLVSPRTSFWLGVGLGILIVGVLVTLAWELLRVELAEAIISQLGQ